MKMNKKKLIVIVGIVLAAVGALVGGLFAAARLSGNQSVYVYNFDIVGMGSYWGDKQESYGPVRSDNIQTVMLSKTQTVTEIMVKVGDQVKKGDVLLSYDTTLSDLALEKKRLAVEQLKLQLIQEKGRLGELLDTPPYTPSTNDYGGSGGTDIGGDEPEEDPESVITELEVRFVENSGHDGSSQTKALICPMPNSKKSVVEQDLKDVWNEVYKKAVNSQALFEMTGQGGKLNINPDEFYVVFKATVDNHINSDTVIWQGMHLFFLKDTDEIQKIELFDAAGVTDYTKETSTPSIPDFDIEVDVPALMPTAPEEEQGPVYTREQLTQMIEEQRKKILEVEYRIKVAEAEYSIAQREMKDGCVYSEVDGKVVSVLTQEEAEAQNQPIIKVSGGGGFYVSGSISELNREELAIGAEVTVIDQRSGQEYPGLVESVGDFPVTGSSVSGGGNPNVTYYPFTVFVDESADLVAGNYVRIQYSLTQAEAGIYVNNPFIRKEKGESYVYLRGADGKLEKRTVRTGKCVWGSYTEVLSGITKEDRIAFPYGKNVRPGAPTADGDYSTLYEER